MLSTHTQDSRPGLLSPSLRDWFMLSTPTQDCVLGYSQPSLRDWLMFVNSYPGLRPGLLSAVPSGLVM